MPKSAPKSSKNKPMQLQTPTTKGNLLAQFIESVHELQQSLGAWYQFGADVTAFLNERKLTAEFEASRAKRARPAS